MGNHSKKDTFPEDHYVPALRGEKQLTPGGVRRVLSKRAVYLQKRIEERRLMGEPYFFFAEELTALVQMMVVYEEKHPPAVKEDERLTA